MTTALTLSTMPNEGEMKTINQLGAALSASGFFKDVRDKGKAAAKILYGRELGIGPVQALLGIDFANGTLSLRAHTMAALIKRSGRYDYRVVKNDPTGVEIHYFQVEWEPGPDGKPKRRLDPIGVSKFGPEDAKRAKADRRATYLENPTDMFYNRAMSKGARMHCPDVFGAPVYVEGEVTGRDPEEIVPPTDGEIEAAVDAAATVVAAEPTSQPPEPAEVHAVKAEVLDGRVTLDELGAKPAETPDALRPDAPPTEVARPAGEITAEEAADLAALETGQPSRWDFCAVELAKRVLLLPSGAPIDNADAKDLHGFAVDWLGGGEPGKKAAKAAWATVGVTVKPGAVVTREQACGFATAVAAQRGA